MRIQEPRPLKEWCFLGYQAGQADAGKMATAALLDLQKTGSDANTDVVVFQSRSGWWPEQMLSHVGLFRGETGAGTYELGAGREQPPSLLEKLSWLPDARKFAGYVAASPAQLPAVPLDKECNAGSPATLKKFLLESIQRYPARHYAVFLTGHGAAFGGQLITHAPEGRVQNEELARLLREVQDETGKSIDLVNLNTCFGANLETLYPLRKATGTVVASEGETFAGTQPLGAILANLQARLQAGQSVDGPELARICVQESDRQLLSNSYTRTLSAFDTTRLEPLAQALEGFQQRIVETGVDPKEIGERLRESKRFLYNSHERSVYLTDLQSFAQTLADHPQCGAAAREVLDRLHECVIAEEHADPRKETFTDTVISRVLGHPDLRGIGGMTAYLDDNVTGKDNRLAQIQKTEYGQAHPNEKFLQYVATGAPKPGLGARIGQGYTKVCQTVTSKLGVPELAGAARFLAIPFTAAAVSTGLRAAGVPLGPLTGGLTLAFGGYQLVRGTRDMLEVAGREGGWDPYRRRDAINAGTRLVLSAGQATLGLMGLGMLPPSVLPAGIACMGLAAEGARFAELLANRKERAEYQASRLT